MGFIKSIIHKIWHKATNFWEQKVDKMDDDDYDETSTKKQSDETHRSDVEYWD